MEREKEKGHLATLGVFTMLAVAVLMIYGLLTFFRVSKEKDLKGEADAASLLRKIHRLEADRGAPLSVQEVAQHFSLGYRVQSDAARDEFGYQYRFVNGHWYALSPGNGLSFGMDRGGTLQATGDKRQLAKYFEDAPWYPYAPLAVEEK
jgi:hypothetical protein